MPLGNIWRPFLASPLGAVATEILFNPQMRQTLSLQNGSAFLLAGWLWLVTFMAGAILVLPILVFIPRTRRPVWWVAMCWGAIVAIVAAEAISGGGLVVGIAAQGLYELMLAGALSGLTYAILIRRHS